MNEGKTREILKKNLQKSVKNSVLTRSELVATCAAVTAATCGAKNYVGRKKIVGATFFFYCNNILKT